MRVDPFNIGLGMFIPHASGYSLIRRTMIANPGISYQKLNQGIQQASARPASLPRTIINRHPERYRPTLNEGSTGHQKILRNCPECSKHQYHTEIFNQLWATHCPIHNTELVKICAGCGQIWPDVTQINGRDCSVCGSLSSGRTDYSELAKMASECLAPIYDAITHLNRSRSSLLSSNTPYYSDTHAYWKSISTDNPLYGSLLAQQLGKPDRHLLDKLSHNTEKLINYDCDVEPIPELPSIDNLAHQKLSHDTDNVTVIRNVLKSIGKITQHSTIKIRDYRCHHHFNMITGESSDVLSLALSVWLLYIASRGKHQAIGLDANAYWCFCDGGIRHFPEPDDFIAIQNSLGEYSISEKARRWAYQRSLTIMFILIHRYVTSIFLSCDAFKPSPWDSLNHCQAMHYSAHYESNRCRIYYLDDTPLETYLSGMKQSAPDSLCSNTNDSSYSAVNDDYMNLSLNSYTKKNHKILSDFAERLIRQ